MARKKSPAPGAAAEAPPAAEPVPAQKIWTLTPARALAVPLGFIVLLAAFLLLPVVRASPGLVPSIAAAATALLVFAGVILARGKRDGAAFALDFVARKQHWLQACAHLSIYLYWGFYWREVYRSAHLFAAQLCFAFAFDILLGYWRRRAYTLGFGPFPIVFSTNLFLWFKPQWFVFQFAMLATGFLAKELIRWNRDGRRVHIFNPSSFPLSLVSLILLATGTADITVGRDISITQFYPPHIYLWIFLVGLPGQFFFGVTSMTFSAVATVTAFSAAYLATTGTYFFFSDYIPIAVFLGMHLLFTDPSTSPRTELGRIFFGVAYGSCVIALYALLGAAGVDTFYDKLLPVPILNLLVPFIERLSRSPQLAKIDPSRLWPTLPPRRRNLAYMSAWGIFFLGASALHVFGDTSPGSQVPFWIRACREHRRNACDNLAAMETRFCGRGVGWACNELGALVATRQTDSKRNPADLFQQACTLGATEGCDNLRAAAGEGGSGLRHGEPTPSDYLAMMELKVRVKDHSPLGVLRVACEDGWSQPCFRAGLLDLAGEVVPRDPARAAKELAAACEGDAPAACVLIGKLLRSAGGEAGLERARKYERRACEAGIAEGCDASRF